MYNGPVIDLIKQIKLKNKDLKEAEIEGILYLLVSDKIETNRDLIRVTGLPKETLRSFKKSISDILQKVASDKILLKADIISDLSSQGLQPYKWRIVEYSEPELEQKLKNIRKKYNVESKREYDQFFATANTSISKVKAMGARGQIKNKKIALLGDDDLVSICLNFLKEKPLETAVFDIDGAILNVIERISKDQDYINISTKIYDARKKLEKVDYGRFDVVTIDPPYTKSGIKLFLNRAIQLLKKDDTLEGKYIYLFYGNSFKSPEKTIKVQEIISDFKLIIEDRIDKFARYHGAGSIGSASALYILKTTKFTQPLDENLLSESIYTFEDRTEEKFPYVDHYVFKLNKVPGDLVKSKSKLAKATSEFCRKHKLKVVDKKITRFKGEGMTLTYILSNSNLLVHTWPEYNALHVDLVTCSPIYNKENLVSNLSKIYKTKSLEVVKVE